jgi:hypothetical protein
MSHVLLVGHRLIRVAQEEMHMNSEYESSETSASEEVSDNTKQAPNQSTRSTIEATPPARSEKDRGPRSRQGKENSKYNALKHGIFSKVVLLENEPRAEFNSLLRGLRIQFEPNGTLEELLVDKLVILFWRLRRLIIADRGQPVGGLTMGFADILGSSTPDLLLRYESTLDRAIERTLEQLERQQRIRNGQALPPTLNVNVSS